MAVFRVTFAADSLFRNASLNVILPIEAPPIPGLPPKPEKFKTLYLLHGFSGNHDDWLDYSQIREIAEQNNLAIVMPSAENSWYIDTGVMGAQYMSYIAKDIVEFTRKTFPLSDKREDTFIGGLSMGGFGALRIGSLYHEVFSKIFTLSGAFIVDNIADRTPGYRDEIADYDYYVRCFGDLSKIRGTEKDPIWCVEQAVAAGNMPELYMAIGRNDFLIKENRAMKKALTKRGVKFSYTETKGIHDWVFWRSAIGPAVNWLLETDKKAEKK